MNCCKIICCYFGERREIHNTPKDIISFIVSSIDNELTINNGVNTDIILVINGEGGDFLYEYQYAPTKNGKIIIEKRDNYGASFGCYFDIFKKYHNNYDYFFFCEDDVLIYKNGYINDFITEFNASENNGFVCLAPLSKINPLHSGGGCGLTSKNRFLEVYPLDSIPDFKLNPTYNDLISYEISFTNTFHKKGYKLINVDKYSPLAVNYQSHYGQNNNFDESMLNKEHIYKVGN
jgi:hypothetical protein